MVSREQDSNVYLKLKGERLFVFEGFLDDVTFGDDDTLSMDFAKDIKKEFEMSMIGEIKLFIGL